MIMAAAPSRWLPLQDVASEFRAECAAMSRFSDELLDEVDSLRSTLARKADELASLQQQLDEREQRLSQRSAQLDEQRLLSARLAQQLEMQEAQFAKAIEQLSQLQQQVADLPRAPVAPIDAPTADVRPTWLDEVDQLRLEISEAQDELSSAIHRAAEAMPAPTPTPTAPVAVDESALRERLELESELELVRSRAVELQDTVELQRQELAEVRADLSEELRQVRRLLEEQVEAPPPPRTSAPRPQPAAVNEPTTPPAASDDPVTNSVMAQFAKLQKDMVQRRKKK